MKNNYYKINFGFNIITILLKDFLKKISLIYNFFDYIKFFLKKKNKIIDIGLAFNNEHKRELIHRTGIILIHNVSLKKQYNIIKKNFFINNNSDIFRIKVNKDKYWFSNLSIENLFKETVFIKNEDSISDLRRGDKFNDINNIAKVILSPVGKNKTKITTLFRHDLIDGLHICFTGFKLVYESGTPIYKRLIKKKNRIQKIKENIYEKYLLINGLYSIPDFFLKRDNSNNQNYYLGFLMDINKLKEKCKIYNCSLNTYINCVFVIAFFNANKEKKKCTLAINMLNEIKKFGNNVSIGIINIDKSDFINIIEQFDQKRKGEFFKKSYVYSKFYTQNYSYFSEGVRNLVDNNHNNWDFLGSNCPGQTNNTYPVVLDSNVIRERDVWSPNIWYGIGHENIYNIDLYWNIPIEFNKKNFEETLKYYFKPEKISYKVPIGY